MPDTTFALALNGSDPAYVVTVAPPTVSARRHLRTGVPDIYRRDATARRDQPPPFAMRFLEALEEVLDPIVATLDSLQPHLDADLSPEHVLAGLATWLGVDDVERMPAPQRRDAVRRAGELAQLRGTRAGLELALELFFPEVPMYVNDHGGVVVSDDTEGVPPPAGAASFEVVCDQSLPPESQMAVARCIERWKPVHASYKLRVRRGDRIKTLPAVPRAPSAGPDRAPDVEPPRDADPEPGTEP